MAVVEAKSTGSYYTPPKVARTLVNWAVRNSSDRLLDPACGEGAFLQYHSPSTGVERNPGAAAVSAQRTKSRIHVSDFFAWAAITHERFDCAVGNPPFIRYQSFSGEVRKRALSHCHAAGVKFSALAASWAPFLVATASLLRPGGRMAFIVPSEIGHAPYATPLIEFLTKSFDFVQLVAVRDKIFPELSQDVWVLFADGFTGQTTQIALTTLDQFQDSPVPPRPNVQVSLKELSRHSMRLRPFLLPADVLQLYEHLSQSSSVCRLGERAAIGIGYVTGANDFFHLRPSEAESSKIPKRFLRPTVRNARSLPKRAVTPKTVTSWIKRDDPCLLLHLTPQDVVPQSIRSYLDSKAGRTARSAYKCRTRTPWYAVPHVATPDGFLSYMCGSTTSLVANRAECVCTNSVHAVRMRNGYGFRELHAGWKHPLTQLSVELEGHPLGGGMLKLEPGEAKQVLVPAPDLRVSQQDIRSIESAIYRLREWRHYA